MALDLTDPSLSYLLGLLQTDGHHSGDIRHKGRVSLEIAERDAEVLNRLAAILPVSSSLRVRTRVTNFSNGRNYTTVTLTMYDQEFRQWLAAVGLPPGKKSVTIAPPGVPYSRPDYLRGILDGDGSVGFTRTGSPFVSFITASEYLAEYFCAMTKDVLGKPRTANRNARDNVYNLMVTNRAAAELAAYVWHPYTELSIPRKLTSARAVAVWKPPAGSEGRYDVMKKRWSAEEDVILLSVSDAEAAALLGRTMKSVSVRRWRLDPARRRTPSP